MKQERFFLLLIFMLTAACAEEFDPYFRVERLRVLGLQSTSPTLLPGESARLSPIIHNQNGSELRYQWSWCPFSAGSSDAYECALTYEELTAQLPEGVEVLPYELGTTAEVDFAYPVPPPLVDLFCESLATQTENLPDFVELPSCIYGLPIYITMTVDNGNEKIQSVRKINLATNESQVNRNPTKPQIIISSMEEKITLDSSKMVFLQRDSDYTLEVQVDPSSSETYVDQEGNTQSESLIVSWFVQAGNIEKTRTGYYPNQNTLDDLINQWKTPTFKDYSQDEIILYVVLRDNRQGLSYHQFTFGLE